MKRILYIGPYSEVGGVSIHVRRLSQLVSDNYNVEIIDESKLIFNDGVIYNLRSGRVVKYFQLILTSNIIHIHTSINWLRLIHVLLSKILFKEVILTIHSLTHITSKNNFFLLKLASRCADKVICVNNIIKNKLGKSSYIVIPAYLPPILHEENDLPEELQIILDINKNRKIIVSNAYRLVLFNGQDLYGFDLLIEVARKIKVKKDNFKIILIVSSLENNNELLSNYTNMLIKEKLENQISILPYSISFVKLIQRSDMVVRATNTDGDSLTIRESIFLNKPVIASDVIERPKGTILFKNRDSNDLYTKILENINKQKKPAMSSNLEYKKFYLNLYNNNK